MNAEHVWFRYLPGLLAAAGGAALIGFAPAHRRIVFTILATLLGLTCMEAEYWVAHGFPSDEVSFFAVTALITLAALFMGKKGGFILAITGLGFLAYVNIRYGSPYLLDYILPVEYALLLALARRELGWYGSGVWAPGRPELIWLVVTNVITVWRTSVLDKWGWIMGRPW
jgi:hypothetical protein